MSTEVIMPQMGESIAEGTITRWLVDVGANVERDQPLVEISTDKVDAEIPSPASGVLLQVLFPEGETVEVDTVIAYIGAADEASASSAGQAAPASSVAEEAAAAAPVAPAAAASASGAASEEERVRVFSSPVVRRIAQEHGVDIGDVSGSGLQGRVTKKDILQYLENQTADEAAPAAAPSTAAAPSPASESAPSAPAATAAPPPSDRPSAGGLVQSGSSAETVYSRPRAEEPAASTPAPSRPKDELSFSVPAYTENERVEIEPMSRIRRLTAAHMLYSKDTSAHVTTVFEVDLSGVVAARQRAKDAFLDKTGTKLTFMPFFFQSVIDGLRTYPKFNASIDGTNIVFKKDINLGIAVAVDWGLIVPVIKHADRLNMVGLATAANDLADRARTKRLSPEDVQGGTFTITNPGVFGSLYGTPLINQPQVAILCLGAIEKRPVVVTDARGNDSIAIRSMAYLALSYDHRLIDGADAEHFMSRVKTTLTDSTWEELLSF